MNKAGLIKIISLLFFFPIFILKIAGLTGCANQIPPTGGDRDSLPPMLVKVTPEDSALNFSNKTITFTFDEFIEDVQQQNPYQNIIISPVPKTFPTVESRLRTLTVKLKDTLEANTTYYINFGDVIKDVNERNPLKDFSYIFTTGTTIDSLQLSGKVVMAETGETDSTLMVFLYKDGRDSAVLEKPRFMTKVDGKGNFRFQYLPAGTYYIYAVKDNNGQRNYSKTQPFAFSDSAVEIKSNAAPVTLYAFIEEKDQPLTPTVTFTGNTNRGGPARNERLRFTTSATGNMQDLLGEFSLNFDKPIRNLDTTKMQLSTDTTFNPVPSSWELDSLSKKLTLKINWKEGTRYNLILDKDFAEDTSGRKLLKTDTIHFTTRNQADYGSLKVVFPNIDLSQNPVLQFLQGGKVVTAFPITGSTISQRIFNPGDYDLNILYDKNKNGRWDPGRFFVEKRQPELVRPLNKKITIRPNWDNEFEIKL